MCVSASEEFVAFAKRGSRRKTNLLGRTHAEYDLWWLSKGIKRERRIISFATRLACNPTHQLPQNLKIWIDLDFNITQESLINVIQKLTFLSMGITANLCNK